MRRSFIFAGFFAVLAPFAAAQRHGNMPRGSMPARPAAIASPAVNHMAAAGVMRVSPPAHFVNRVVTTRPRTGGTVVRVIRPANVDHRRIVNNDDFGFSEDFSSAPGLGFDETHLAATRGRRFGEHRRHNLNSGFFPFFDGGFIFSTPVVVEQAPPTEVQEEVVEPDTQERVQRVRPRESAPEHAAESAPVPLRETEEYVFVRRDGTVFFAVAYSWENGMLRYVTQDGLRKSITGDSLDLGATQQFNEQRGLSFHAPV